MDKIILTNIEPGINPDSHDLANSVIYRLGLMPRKKGSTERMNKILIELYEKAKIANREKRHTEAVMSVEEMALHAGITRQTMYDYLKRWLLLDLINKTSYVDDHGKVIIGYKLNGATLESAFDKARARINNHLDLTYKFVKELQRVIKNEKIKKTQTKANEPQQEQEQAEE